MRPAWSEGRVGAAVAGSTLLALLLRMIGLAQQSIWADEALSVAWSGVFDRMFLERFTTNLQGPLHALLLHVWSRLFGTGEAALRSLSAILGTLTVPLLFWALRPLRRPGLALLACVLLAVNPYHVWYSQEVRNYILVMFWSVVSLGAFLRLLDPARRRPADWVLYTLANVGGCLSNLSHVFLLAAQGSWLCLGGRTARLRLRGATLSWVVTFILLAPWWVQFYERRVVPSGALGNAPAERLAELRPGTAASAAGIPYAYFAFATGFSYGPSLRELHRFDREGVGALRHHSVEIIAALIGFGLPIGLGLRAFWREGTVGRAWLLWLLLPVVCTFAVAQLNLKMFNVRYASGAFIPFLVVLASGVLAPTRASLRVLLLILVLAPTGRSLVGLRTDPRYWKDDARSAAAALEREAHSGDLLLFVGNELAWREYYWRRPPGPPAGLEVQKVEPWCWADVPFPEQVSRFEQLARAHARVFVLLFRPKDVDPAEQWRRYLDERAGLERREDWPGARLYAFAGGGGR